jgi:hypothetical protein
LINLSWSYLPYTAGCGLKLMGAVHGVTTGIVCGHLFCTFSLSSTDFKIAKMLSANVWED